MRPSFRPLCITLALAGLSLPALAQDAGSTAGFNAHGFNLVAFDGDVRDPLSVARAGRFHKNEWWLGGLVEWAESPLVLVTGPDERQAVLDNVLALNISAGWAPIDRLRLDLTAPVFLTSTGTAGGQGADLSDLRLTASVALIRPSGDEDGGGFGLSLAPHLDLPVGDDSQFVSNSGLAGGVRLAATYELSKLTFSGDLGAQLNPAIELANLGGSDTLLAGLAVGYLVSEHGGINLETRFAPPFTAAETTTDEDVSGTASPSEMILSYRRRADSGAHFTLGGSTALSRGAGAATYRIFLGGGWGRIGEPVPKDTDLDGIIDSLDNCPEVPETFNKYLDEDGCPDELATITVMVERDEKPQPEAIVTVSSPDGDQEHMSTTQPQNYEGIPGDEWNATAVWGDCHTGTAGLKAREGNNMIIVALARTKVSAVTVRVHDEEGNAVPQARVGFASDESPECVPKDLLALDEAGQGSTTVGAGEHFIVVRAEDYAIVRDPLVVTEGDDQLVDIELKATKIKVEEKNILILEKVYFETDKAVIMPVSYELLDEVATTILANPQIGNLEVSGHTDSRGADAYNLTLSDNRAKAVRQYLIAKGVQAERLVAKGYGETKPVDSNNTKKGRANNRRVEFTILGKATSREEAGL